MATLSIEHVGKTYAGGVKVVSDFCLDVRDHEFIVLVGPSGCGKSTMLRMIAGLEGITEGTMVLNGKVINQLPPVERDVAMVFQDYALYGNLSVYDNVGMSLKLRHREATEIYDKVTDTAEFLDITDYLARLPGQLSGGQKQRVALGRAVTRDSKLLLMDEPLSNLDAKLRAHTRTEIVRLQRQIGATTIYVTHDQVEAMTMADRIVVMRDGITQQIGTPQEVYENPTNMFVGGFIGLLPMNFIEGTVREGCFCTDEISLRIPQAQLACLRGYEDRRVILGIRPESIKAAMGRENLLPVRNTENFGYYHNVYLGLGEDTIIARAGRELYLHGGRMPVTFDMDKAHFFDPETTVRIRQEA